MTEPVIRPAERRSADAEWLTCTETRHALGELDATLTEVVRGSDGESSVMAEMTSYLLERGGKRLRPALLFLGARFGSENPRDALRQAAAAVELTHVAALYHDDVMDQAATRRGAPSANRRWGNAQAATAGTYLFARASTALSALGDEVAQLGARASVELCKGQLQEAENAYNLEHTPSQYVTIASRKTGTLFQLPCSLGAVLARSDEITVSALARYGQLLGVAFQVMDDVMDIAEASEQPEKTRGLDLREGIYGLPVLLTLEEDRLGTELRGLLSLEDLGDREVDAAHDLVRRGGALAKSVEFARWYVNQADAQLRPLLDGAAKSSLHRLCELVSSN